MTPNLTKKKQNLKNKNNSFKYASLTAKQLESTWIWFLQWTATLSQQLQLPLRYSMDNFHDGLTASSSPRTLTLEPHVNLLASATAKFDELFVELLQID